MPGAYHRNTRYIPEWAKPWTTTAQTAAAQGMAGQQPFGVGKPIPVREAFEGRPVIQQTTGGQYKRRRGEDADSEEIEIIREIYNCPPTGLTQEEMDDEIEVLREVIVHTPPKKDKRKPRQPKQPKQPRAAPKPARPVIKPKPLHPKAPVKKTGQDTEAARPLTPLSDWTEDWDREILLEKEARRLAEEARGGL